MDTGISSSEACQTHSLTQEDFARMCNPDGSLKNQPSTTTFTLKDSSSESPTINDNVLYVSVAALVLVVVCVIVLFVKLRRKKA